MNADQLAEELYEKTLRNQEFEVEPEDKLNKQEIGSALWQKVSAFLKEDRDKLHKMNESDLSQTETATVRGQIRQINRILSLAEETLPGQQDEPDDPNLGY